MNFQILFFKNMTSKLACAQKVRIQKLRIVNFLKVSFYVDTLSHIHLYVINKDPVAKVYLMELVA